MNRPKTMVPVRVLLGLACLAVACGDGTTEPPPPPDPPRAAKLAVTPATASLTALGQTEQLTAQVLDQNGQPMAGAAVAWSSGNASVATVNANGLVTAAGNGSATITATSGAASGSAAVTVEQAVSAVAVSPAADTLVASGDTVHLAADATDANSHSVEDAEFTWASGDTAIATVDASGLVTGVTAGDAEITATSSGVTGSAALTVVDAAPATVAVTPDTVALTALGQTERLSAEVRDQIGRVMEGVAVSWSSADTAVATVDSVGLVTAAGGGATTIVAAAGDASGDAVVTVTQSAASVVVHPATDTIAPGDTVRLTAAVYDENGHAVEDAEFAWSSSDASVATVDGSGLVTGVAEGTATIAAAAGDAGGTAEITVENPDRAALVAIYNATDGPNWIDDANWLTDAPLRDWYGVWTDAAGRVLRLQLPGRWDSDGQEQIPHGLSGEIPPEIGALTNLALLDLGWNELYGPIPPELLGLSNLESLDLDRNNLSGPIPPELGDLSNLSYLGLNDNALHGPIPPELGDLSNLEFLDLGFNELSGAIPTELSALSNLEFLSLRFNELSGSIPPELGGLSNLERLFLDGTELSGPIPPTLLDAPLRRFFWGLRNSGLCAPGVSVFVQWLDSMEEVGGPYCNAADRDVLTRLFETAAGTKWTESSGWLGGPALELWHGVEADSVGRVTALGLSDNGLSGSLPVAIADLGRLTSLRIDGNELGGRLPLSLSRLDLAEFHYHGTNLCEPVDAGFRTWLGGIPSREGTGVECLPLSDRDVLVALYTATGGPNWTSNGNWLSEEPLGDWYGVEVDDGGRVVRLALGGNNLQGPILPELGGLANLESLELWENSLVGDIPPQVGNLANLRSLFLDFNDLTGGIPVQLGNLTQLGTLSIQGNDLTGSIPTELADLSKLGFMALGSNRLTGAIPRELGGLSNLTSLSLSGNDLAGHIPPELGGLSDLTLLSLSGNDLAGPIPPELGGLSDLTLLSLSGNDLAGPIPPELGGLSKLTSLPLSGNDLSGPVPPELGGLTRLTELELSHNPGLAGAMPLGLTSLALESLLATGTELCAPRDPAFEEWLATIPRQRIAPCGEPPAAYLVQAVQSRAHPVPLVAGEDALLRVFVTAAMETAQGIPEVRARFYLNGTERHMADIAGSSTPIPTEIDEGDLSKSANAAIPGRILRPGLEMVVEIDPGGALDPGLGVPGRIPTEGRLAVEVHEMPLLDLTVIPFLWNAGPDSAIIGLVEGMGDDPEGHALLQDTHVLLPVGALGVTAHAPVASTSNNSHDLLSQTEAIRVLEGGGGHYMGMMSGEVTGAGGVAFTPGRSNFSSPHSGTVAHELGHNMDLRHAPCGGASGPDSSFPDPRAAIGAWGYDHRRERLVPAARKDHMSYCIPTWTSDYHFANALRHRLRDEAPPAAAPAAAPVRSLLLWGGVAADGNAFLSPAFVVDAPPALPDSAGDYTVTGRNASGRELFSLGFAMPVALSDEEEVSSFVFALPARPGWEDTLASITLSGPDIEVTLDGGTDMPMAILRDPNTGQVRGFLRNRPLAIQAAADAAGPAAGAGLEVMFSRGIPEAGAWRR